MGPSLSRMRARNTRPRARKPRMRPRKPIARAVHHGPRVWPVGACPVLLGFQIGNRGRGDSLQLFFQEKGRVELVTPRRGNHPRPLLRKEGRRPLQLRGVARNAATSRVESPLLTKEGPGVVSTPRSHKLNSPLLTKEGPGVVSTRHTHCPKAANHRASPDETPAPTLPKPRRLPIPRLRLLAPRCAPGPAR